MNTILFELDETLMPIVYEKLLELYLDELARKLSDLIEPKKVIRYIWESMEMIMMNDGEARNEEVFLKKLKELTGVHYEACLKRLEDFYGNEFKKTRQATSRNSVMIDVVRQLKKKGYKLVVAANPVLPEKAIVCLLRWGGFNADDFDYIASSENSHFAKPNIKFYREILGNLNRNGDECLMVGNDISEDLIANRAGISSYLITDYIIHREQKAIISDYVGNYLDFSLFVQKLPDLLKVG